MYREAQAAVMSILVDNYDHKSKDKEIQANLAKALEWEKSFVKFMHEYPKKNNVSHLFDLAFNSERSIEDELGIIHYLQLKRNFEPTVSEDEYRPITE